MQKAVEDYIESVEEYLKNKKDSDEETSRKRILEEIGFIHKEYSPNKGKSEEYNILDRDKMAYYKQISIDLSDEEWEAVKKAYERKKASCKSESTAEKNNRNNIANILRIFAYIIYIGGAILGFSLGKTVNYFTGEATFSIASALAYWIAFFAAGTMMYGFSEIVRLLQIIADK